MGRIIPNKRGVSAVGVTLISIILLLAFFAIVFYGVLGRLFSHDVQLSVKERWCQITVSIKNSLPVKLDEFWYPICSTERIKVTQGTFDDAMLEGDTLEDGGVRTIYDLMRRCKFMIGGDQKGAVFSGQHCYICYVVETGDDAPTINAKQFDTFSLLKRTDQGDSYLKDLQSPGFSSYHHEIVLQTDITKNSDYAIIYVDNIKPSEFAIWAQPVGGCILGKGVGSLLPGVGPAIGCAGGLVGGLAKSAYDEVLGRNVNKIYFTRLKDLKQGGPVCGGGFEY